MADPDRGLWEGTNCRGTQVLKINRISLAYELASHKDQAFINKSCFFSRYIEEYVDFVQFSGDFLGWWWWSRLASLDSPLKVMAPRPWLIRISVYLHNLKTISAHIISKKCMQIIPYIGKLYHRFEKSVPESESRQFDQLRLRLRLLSRYHDSRRLRLRLRPRLRTPGYHICGPTIRKTANSSNSPKELHMTGQGTA